MLSGRYTEHVTAFLVTAVQLMCLLNLALLRPTAYHALFAYCIGALALPTAKIQDLGVCWNDCFRKLFGSKWRESVKKVQYFCGELSFDLIYELQRWAFLDALHKLCDRLTCLYKVPLINVLCASNVKFGYTDSIGRMQLFERDFFGRLYLVYL